MRKIIILGGIILSAVLAACADSSEKSASREYVRASQKVARAAAAYNAADYSSALKLCIEAQNDVSKIVDKYPDSSIVLKVVTDRSTLIGPCSYLDMVEKIIPRLEIYETPDMKPVELAWIVAVSQKAGEPRDRALFSLAMKSLKADWGDRIDDKTLAKIIETAVAHVKSPELRSELKSRISRKLAEAAQPVQAQSASADAKREEAAAPSPAEVKQFLKQARTDSALVAYDLKAAESLREKAALARSLDKPSAGEFSKILTAAYDNVLKISARDSRDKAMSSIAAAFANMGDDLRAIAIVQKIESPESFTSAFYAIADSAGRGKNYADAVALSKRVAEGAEKDKFLAELAAGVASQGLYEDARAIAASVKDASARNVAFARLARAAFDAGSPEEAAKSVSKIDISDLSCLTVLDDGPYSQSFNPTILTGLRLADLAEKIIPADAKLGEALNNLAIAESQKSSAPPKEFAILSGKISRNLMFLGKSSDALDFISQNIHNGDSSSALENIYIIAAGAQNNIELERKAFALASNICETLGVTDKVGLALAVQTSNLSDSAKAEILAPFLPKFQ